MKIAALKNSWALIFSVAVVGCGQNSSMPIALTRVMDGSNSELGFKPENLAPTLLEQVVKNGVPQTVAATAFAKYDEFQEHVKVSTWMAMIDFTRPSSDTRFYMVNLQSGAVEKILVAHGAGSDPTNSGMATKFSNIPNSKMTSLGAYIVAEKFHSSVHGTAARLDGLESTNSFARPRAVVLHSAGYVSPTRKKMGMSWGCPAVGLENIATALSRLSGGGFMYAFGPAPAATPLDETHMQEMMLNPSFHWINEFEEAPWTGEGGDQ